MIVDDVVQELHAHAVGSTDASGPGLADVLWRSREEPDAPNLQNVWVELVRLFDALAPETSGWLERGVPASCSYAVAEILARATKIGLAASEVAARHEGALLAWRVATAWEALMAGDISDVEGHVTGEEWALGHDSREGA